MSLLDLIPPPDPVEAELRAHRGLVSSRWTLRRMLRGLTLRELEILARCLGGQRILPADVRMIERELRRKRRGP